MAALAGPAKWERPAAGTCRTTPARRRACRGRWPWRG